MKTIVIGAGLSGLTVGARLSEAGAEVEVLSKGWGVLHWHAGTIDVLGADGGGRVMSPSAAIETLIATQPDHPYVLVGVDGVAASLDWLVATTAATVGLSGTIESNQVLISATGGPRPTCLAPRSMVGGRHDDTAPTLIVGLDRFPDFSANLVASNLNASGGTARAVDISIPGVTGRTFFNGVTIANALDDPAITATVIEMVSPYLGTEERVGFPAVLGLSRHRQVFDELEASLGRRVFEIPILPPSVPGMRIHRTLVELIGHHRVHEGMEVIGIESGDGRVTSVLTEAAARPNRTPGDRFVIATGGILGGGIVAGYDGSLREVVAGLDVSGPPGRSEWFRTRFADGKGHPVYRSGVGVDGRFSAPEGPDNVTVVGHTLGGTDAIREKSVDGIALATGYKAADLLMGDAGVHP